jgi:hypothetical protein
MVNYNKLREFLSDMEHQQWEQWSRNISKELIIIRDFIFERKEIKALAVINDRLKRWKNCWIPYDKLREDVKDSDREWADKILDSVPFKCPVYQCGGLMETVERPYPKGMNEDDFPDGMPGDLQLPDLVCKSCGALYQFQKFKNKRG